DPAAAKASARQAPRPLEPSIWCTTTAEREQRDEPYLCLGRVDALGRRGTNERRPELRSRLLEEHDDDVSECAGGAGSVEGGAGRERALHRGCERAQGRRRLLEDG